MEEGEEMTYEWVREYHWTVRHKYVFSVPLKKKIGEKRCVVFFNPFFCLFCFYVSDIFCVEYV